MNYPVVLIEKLNDKGCKDLFFDHGAQTRESLHVSFPLKALKEHLQLKLKNVTVSGKIVENSSVIPSRRTTRGLAKFYRDQLSTEASKATEQASFLRSFQLNAKKESELIKLTQLGKNHEIYAGKLMSGGNKTYLRYKKNKQKAVNRTLKSYRRYDPNRT